MLILVDVSGEISKGAQRWLNLGFIRFQPSEIAKLSVPLMVASYLGNRSLRQIYAIPVLLWRLLLRQHY
ncbi:FtsW/RodA/SpoVE family cell cycle protein [Glaesserella parasuis]|uniref:FtsW/RodA/SpoVE family cell cycle protein n=1 Tax=Glaesserella parasuis TaxID=738 RepID=UPI001EEF557A|nr:FtsW/RodA/SpoVE family cell cycle protein [Glaesserella parasuis]